MGCESPPSFRFGSGRHTMTATVSDSISGSVTPVVSARVKTTRSGSFTIALEGFNQAGTSAYAYCAYTVLPMTFKPAPDFGYALLSGRRYATVRRLVVVRVAATAAVNLVCRGSGCPFKAARNVTGKLCAGRPCVAKRRAGHGSVRTIALTPLLAGHRLSPTARLTVSVTAPNTVGRVWQLTLRRGKAPSLSADCLEPGSVTPGKGCAAPASHK